MYTCTRVAVAIIEQKISDKCLDRDNDIFKTSLQICIHVPNTNNLPSNFRSVADLAFVTTFRHA